MKTKKEVFNELEEGVDNANSVNAITNLLLYGIMEALIDIRDILNHDTKSTK